MPIEVIDANEAALAKHLQQQEEAEIQYEQMLDEIEDSLDIESTIELFNKIVSKYGFELDFMTWLKDR